MTQDLTLLLKAQDMASATLSRLKGNLDSLNDRALNVAKGGFRSMANTWQNTASAISNSLPIIGAGFIGLSGYIIKLASDSQETRNRFNAVFGSMQNDAETFVKALSSATGRSVDQIRQGLSAFQSIAVGLGLGQKEATAFSKELQTLAVDFGSFHNISDQETMTRFIAAISGSSEVLDQFGVNIRVSALDIKLLEKGFPRVSKGATEAQKAIARLEIIKDTMGKQGAIGDAIKTTNDFANQLRRLRSITNDYAVIIGARLVPVGEKLLSWFFKIIPSIDQLNNILNKSQERIKAWVDKGLIVALPIIASLGGKTAVLRTFLAGLAGIILALVIPAFVILIAKATLVLAPFVLLGVAVGILYQAWIRNFGGIKEKTQVVFGYLIATFNIFKNKVLPLLIIKLQEFSNVWSARLQPALENFLSGAWENLALAFNYFKDTVLPLLIVKLKEFSNYWTTILQPGVETFLIEAWGLLLLAFNHFKDVILPLLILKLQEFAVYWSTTLQPALENFLTGAWNNMVSSFIYFKDVILPLLIIVFDEFKRVVLEQTVPALKELWAVIQADLLPTMMEVWNFISPVLLPLLGAGLVAALMIGINGFTRFIEILKIVITWATQTKDNIVRMLDGINTFMFGIFTGNWSQAWEGAKNVVISIVDTIKTNISGIASTIDSVIGGLGNLANSAMNIGSKVKGSLPSFAVGTSHFSGGLAQINENGPEIVNLPAGAKVTTATKSEKMMSNSQSQSSQPINISINFQSALKPNKAEARELADYLKPELIKILKLQT